MVHVLYHEYIIYYVLCACGIYCMVCRRYMGIYMFRCLCPDTQRPEGVSDALLCSCSSYFLEMGSP